MKWDFNILPRRDLTDREEKVLQSMKGKIMPQENNCLLWTGTLSSHGNPVINFTRTKRGRGAKSFLYDVFVDELDANKTIFCSCDNKLCLNVSHLIQLSNQKGQILQTIGWHHQNKPIEELSNLKRLNSLLENGKVCGEHHEEREKKCECLLWCGYMNDRGYGKTEGGSVHRIRWQLENGEIPKNLQMRHKCKNHRNCYNIDHLELGTAKENCADKIRDGTAAVGEKNPSAKIDANLASQIRNSKGSGTLTSKERAEQFGVSVGIVQKIDSNSTWDPQNTKAKIK